MSPAEENDLLAMGADLAAAAASPWQPGCIAAAFATPRKATLVLTMQRWIDLDAAHSPLLLGALPETTEDLSAALEVFELEWDEAAHTALVAGLMLRACELAFATTLRMAPEGGGAQGADDGFGDWLPLFGCLITQCGLSPEAALGLRVDQAFALVAAMRRNEGWRVAGTPYALRPETGNRKAETGKAAAESGGRDDG